MLAGGRSREHCWGRLLREVWWFLNWLLPPRSHPALLFKWIKKTKPNKVIDALPISAVQQPRGVNEARQDPQRSARELQTSRVLPWHDTGQPSQSLRDKPLLAFLWGLQRHGSDTDPFALAVLCSCVQSHNELFWRANILGIAVQHSLKFVGAFASNLRVRVFVWCQWWCLLVQRYFFVLVQHPSSSLVSSSCLIPLCVKGWQVCVGFVLH